jgi:DNA-directed RNA polymerase specialized sigma24 family protein
MVLDSLLLRARRGDRDAVASLSLLEQTVGDGVLERYEGALMRLAVDDRNAIVARIERGLAWNEVAKELGVNTEELARTAVTRALVRLAREMSNERV